jgi:hypothetical protein
MLSLDDSSELPYDLFLGVPKHRVPDVVAASGMTEKGWIPVNPQNLETRFPGVYYGRGCEAAREHPRRISIESRNHAWEPIGQSTDDELKAIWLYVQSIPAEKQSNE